LQLNIPNILTWIRIAAIPLFIAVLYFPEAQWISTRTANLAATIIFIAAAITDWFDGYLARKLNQTSAFGAFLDPVADKLMVAAAVVVLAELGRAHGIAAFIIVGREIAISALREWMAQIGNAKRVRVALIGKVKTVAQLVAIPFLLYDDRLFGLFHTTELGRWLLWIAVALTIASMVQYFWVAFSDSKHDGG
jgi:cardiolipin synthase (CMP-forming)